MDRQVRPAAFQSTRSNRRTAIRILIIMILAIFVVEIGTHFVAMDALQGIPEILRSLIDSFLLTLVLFPLLFLLAYRPLLLEIANRQRAEIELRKISRAVEQSPASTVITDPQGNIEYVNPKFTSLTGYSLAEAIGQNSRILKSGRTSPEDYKRLWETILSGDEWQGEFLNKKKNGELYWESASISPIKDSQGVITHFVAVKEDITERKRTQEELERAVFEAEHRAAELNVANQELQSFAYSVAHDLRAPLRHINAFNQQLMDEYQDRLDDQAREYFQKVRICTLDMAQMIDDLLNLSRVTRGEMKRMPVDLSEIVQSIAADLRRGNPERQVEFHIEPGVTANGDPRLLSMALKNLLENAWKFTAKCPLAQIEFGVIRQDEATTYFVKDNGVGFDMAYVSKLFGTFQRLHRAEEFPGTGIGLAIVQRIVHRHGGRIWAEGEVNKGATFYFTVPAA